MRFLVGLVSGLVFGCGLVVAQMTDPRRIIGFLDLLGAWDPTLACVMAGAILTHAPVVMLMKHRGRPWFADRLQLPRNKAVDGRLIAGSAIFGVGWGLAGYCPGPAIVASTTHAEPLWACIAMFAGILGHDVLHNKLIRMRSNASSRIGLRQPKLSRT